MWDKRESNMMHRDQNMNSDSVGSEIPYMQHIRFPPPNNVLERQFYAEASRKRKSMDMDLGGDGGFVGYSGNMGGTMGYPLRSEHSLQQNLALPPRADSQSKMPEVFFSRNVDHASNAESRYGTFQFSKTDNSLVGLEPKYDNMNISSFECLPSRKAVPSFPVHKIREISEQNDPEHLICSTNSYESAKYPSHYRQRNTFMEMPKIALRSLDDGTNAENGIDTTQRNPFLYPFSIPSNGMAISNSSQTRVVNENAHSDGGNFGQTFRTNKIFEGKNSGLCTGLDEGRSFPLGSAGFELTPAFSEARDPYDVYKYHNTETHTGNFISSDSLGAFPNIREQSTRITSQTVALLDSSLSKKTCLDHGDLKNNTHATDFETRFLEKSEEPNSESKRSLLGNECSPHLASCSACIPVTVDDGLTLNLKENTSSVPGKVSPLVVEKLWDGSLQLNTCTTVSAVAIFKSGEKAPDIKWSEHVEVKGKVRLQAFEKFIQELRRSRSRALMVISLCWKAGSSEAGLTGIKEVAKGYKESERVGYAQICAGVDLYVCPRSDTIITIIAKYGFFKGLAAVEEDPDSLIGCVIWRRAQTSSNTTVLKVPEKKKITLPDQQPQNSPDFSAPEINSPITIVDDSMSKQETVENKTNQSTNNFSHGFGSSNVNTQFEMASSIPYSSPLVPVEPPVQKLEPVSLQEVLKNPADSISLQDNIKQPVIPKTQEGEAKRDNCGVEPLRPMPLGPPQIPLQTTAQFNISLYDSRNYSFFPPSEPRPSVPIISPSIGAPIPTTQNINSSFEPNQIRSIGSNFEPNQTQSDSKPELAQNATPEPPTLPLDFVQRIIQFSRAVQKAEIEETPKTATSFMPIEEPKKPVTSSEAKQKSIDADDGDDEDDDDDGDLPEFDFDSACGVLKAPTNNSPRPRHQAHSHVPPFNKQYPVDEGKIESRPALPPLVQSFEIGQAPRAEFPGKALNTNRETTGPLPSRFQGLNTENRSAEDQSSSRQLPVKVDKDSSSGYRFPLKNRWDSDDDDDDDDMPEWCPPDQEHVVDPPPPPPQPRKTERALSQTTWPAPANPVTKPSIVPSSTALHSPVHNQNFSYGYSYSETRAPHGTANPASMQNAPKPPEVPYPTLLSRFPPPSSDVNWQWKRH